MNDNYVILYLLALTIAIVVAVIFIIAAINVGKILKEKQRGNALLDEIRIELMKLNQK